MHISTYIKPAVSMNHFFKEDYLSLQRPVFFLFYPQAISSMCRWSVSAVVCVLPNKL